MEVNNSEREVSGFVKKVGSNKTRTQVIVGVRIRKGYGKVAWWGESSVINLKHTWDRVKMRKISETENQNQIQALEVASEIKLCGSQIVMFYRNFF